MVQVFRESWRQAYTGVIPPIILDRELHSRDASWWRRALGAEQHVLVLTHDDAVAGYATCGAAREGFAMTGEIYELYLSPVYQGAGLGSHLFEACRATLDRHGFPGLVVWALTGNEMAQSFYRNCGGKPIKRGCVRFGGVSLDRVAFGW